MAAILKTPLTPEEVAAVEWLSPGRPEGRVLLALLHRLAFTWQTMETAPKDGKPFLAAVHDGREPPDYSHEIIVWNDYGRGEGCWMRHDHGGEYAPDAEAKGWARPVLWQPLPAISYPVPQ